MSIKLRKNLKLKVLKQVRIKDNCWNMPGPGYLNPQTVIEITSGPTSISDVPFKVVSGSGQITHRTRTNDITREIKSGSDGFFFSQGHKTAAPYDFGTLDSTLFQIVE